MPKTPLVEERKDFGGGLNVSANPDSLNANELLECVNARVEPFGGITRRPGSKKLAGPLLSNAGGFSNEPLPILGLKQWGPNKEIVAVSGDFDLGSTLFHANAPYTSWAEDASQFSGSTAGAPDFATFRDNSPGAPLVLYIACGSLLKWTGSALTTIVTGLAPRRIRSMGARLFVNDALNPKTLFWSAIGSATFTGAGGASGPGSALVDTLSGDELVSLETLGKSLFIGTNESISRFSGTSDDIQIAQDSDGVSTEIGPSNDAFFTPGAMMRIEQFIFLHSERGLYVATEGGILSIGDKIQHPSASSLHITTDVADVHGLLKPIIGHNRRRNEAWIAYCPVGGTKRNSVLIYNYRRQCWYGPFTYPFGITCFSSYEHTDGIESIMAGCDDACIRLLDDITATSFDDGTTDFESRVEFPPFGLSVGPQLTKSLEHVFLQVQGEMTYSITATGDLGQQDNSILASL